MMWSHSIIFAGAVLLQSTAESSPLSLSTISSRQEANGTAPGNGAAQTVTVAQGDTLTKLGEQFNTGICDIANANNLQGNAINNLQPGDTLTIPPPAAQKDDTSCLPPPAPPASATCVLGGPDRFVGQQGLSVEQTAKFLNITMDSLVQANAAAMNATAGANATAADTAGMILSVPVCPGSSCKISQGTIQEGDIFDAVAAKAGSTTGQILALNPGIDRLNLQVGQTFTLPSECTAGDAQGQAGQEQSGQGQGEQKGDGAEGQGEQKGGDAQGQGEQKGGEAQGQGEQKGGEAQGQEGQKGGEAQGQGEQKGGNAKGQGNKGDEQNGENAAQAEDGKGAEAAAAQPAMAEGEKQGGKEAEAAAKGAEAEKKKAT